MMTPRSLDTFRDLAAAAAPNEACGLLLLVNGEEVYMGCRNISERPRETFALDPQDYLKAERSGTILAICHSHPKGTAEASLADRSACAASALPWYILSGSGEDLRRIEPKPFIAPLVGREFVHGVHDCYSLIRDYYKVERGIELMDFDRDEQWWNRGQSLYVDNFAKAGFVPVTDLRAHDVVLMQIRAKTPNHGGVYMGDVPDVGKGILLHHLFGQLSTRVPFGGFWQRHATHTLRYVGAA